MIKITLEASSERLRMALPLMSKYKVPVTPENYAVWYQFVSGDIKPIREAIDRLIAHGQPVDEAATQALYRRYIQSQDQQHLAHAEDAIRRLIETVGSSLNTADSEITRYEDTLGEYAEELAGDVSAEHFKSLVEALSKSTQQMHESSASLHTHLDESREEVNALKEELKRAKAEAQIDPLTGLANRKGFENGLETIRAQVAGKPSVHTLLIADIDKFKSVNDSYGHLFGDKILKVVAKALDNLTKGKDIAARFGGEEFIVVLPETDIEGGLTVAESIRRNIENGRIFNPKTKEEIRRITISIGVTQFDFTEDINDVIERADAALYRAKENGRNRVEVADVSIQPAVVNA